MCGGKSKKFMTQASIAHLRSLCMASFIFESTFTSQGILAPTFPKWRGIPIASRFLGATTQWNWKLGKMAWQGIQQWMLPWDSSSWRGGSITLQGTWLPASWREVIFGSTGNKELKSLTDFFSMLIGSWITQIGSGCLRLAFSSNISRFILLSLSFRNQILRVCTSKNIVQS
jgi:hypothetical protein